MSDKKFYTVTVEREITEEGYLSVEAASEAEAKTKAEGLQASLFSWDRVYSGKHYAVNAEKDE